MNAKRNARLGRSPTADRSDVEFPVTLTTRSTAGGPSRPTSSRAGRLGPAELRLVLPA
jgi:hypothetical protein